MLTPVESSDRWSRRTHPALEAAGPINESGQVALVEGSGVPLRSEHDQHDRQHHRTSTHVQGERSTCAAAAHTKSPQHDEAD